MTRIAPAPYEPDVAIPPGETISETLEGLGMTQSQLAERMGRPPTKVNEIIRGKRAITMGTAIALERVLGLPASFWLNLENNYRLTLARLEEADSLKADLQWMRDTIPVRELINRELVPATGDRVEQLRAVLSFFGVGSVAAWKKYWKDQIQPAISFRRSKKQAIHVGRTAAWLRLGEIDSQGKQCEPYNKRKFEAALKGIRSATAEGPEVFEPMLNKLRSCGVVVSLIKEIPGAGISGATRWLSKSRAQIQLSLRYKSDDQFWFTFFHEAGHILLHGKESLFLEGANAATGRVAKEEEANRFAMDFLIPPEHCTALCAIKTARQTTAFAKNIGVSPGIVVGRLQHEEHITPQTANYWKVKRRFEWSDE